ncbi:MAG: AAA family ATPase, partial [Dehalococcoidales bacterium]|nr:AAA family ATPase [Dehalococcoidales bacterium]
MDKSRSRTIFVCQQCGREELKWLGRCPACQEWNSLVEKAVVAPSISFKSTTPARPAEELSRLAFETTDRLSLPMSEFNRVLGGGVVAGSLTLIGGDPGIGKSTLLLQVAALVARDRDKVVYVSGEETQRQIKLRAERLGIKGERLYLLAET